MRRRVDLVGSMVVAVVLTLAGGCKQSPAVSAVRAQLEEQIPGAEFEREFHIRLGRMSLGLARKLAGFALDEEDPELAMLRAVRRVDVGSYRVVSLPPIDELNVPPGLFGQLSQSGWNLLVREQSEGERTWVFLRIGDGNSMSSLFVIVLDEVELTLVGVEGYLDEIIASAIADDPDGFISILGS